VIDYLLKPIAFDRFYRAAEKALQVTSNGKDKAVVQQTDQQPAEYLFVKTEHRIQKVNLKDISFIEGLQNYISIHTTTGRILSLQTLKKIEEALPQKEFVRVHKSYIVALRHITVIERSRIFIGDVIIPVGDNYREDFYKIVDKN
jgi:DNA-binding LytR/AlgR family response regulator